MTAVSDDAWIAIVGEQEAEGELEEAYRLIAGRRGKVANIMKVHSLNPAAMRAHMDLYLTLLFGKSKLPRADRELVAVIVSTANDCRYCVQHHRAALDHYWKDPGRIERALRDYRTADLSDREISMLDYSLKLTRTPDSMRPEDLEALRRVGFEDEEILDLNLVVSYFNFVNRIALGLGVEDSAEEVQGYQY